MKTGINLFNQSIRNAISENNKYLLKNPSYILTFSKIIKNIKRQTSKRDDLYIKEDLIVPPILIISITNDCNLSCVGCYACNQKRNKEEELTTDEIKRIVKEAIELGVSIILIAGGEPLLKKGILDIPKAHNSTLFVMFTNGMLLDNDTIKDFKQTKNLIPVISIEGDKDATDKRRGIGVYDNIIKTMKILRKEKIMFGSSITLTSKTYDSIMRGSYLGDLESSGCSITFLIEYVPQDTKDSLVLSPAQKEDLILKEEIISKERDMLAVVLPGNEEKYGGCLASGRGFLHISSEGSLEACPFAPYSDTNVKNNPLKHALKSKLISSIRDNHHLLKESKGGCALNENKKWIESLMED